MSDGTTIDRHEERRRVVLSIGAGLLALVGVAVPLLVFLVSRTSSASFADAEVLSANQLGAAVLDIEVDTGDGSPPTGPGGPGSAEAVFTASNLAPGDRVSGQLEITNAGDLAVRYGLVLRSDGGLLGRWLRFEAWPASGICSPDQEATRVVEDVEVGTTPVVLLDLAGIDDLNTLAPGASSRWCLGAELPLDTPNEAQGQRLDLTLVVTAEQAVAGGR